jgi:3-phenylpropionate/trans-cinnamate dioxygenase ferredoxin reductase component
MSNLHVKYLLVGGGIASSEAARAIREVDPVGDLLLISQEINRPYHRPPLSQGFLRGELGRQRLYAQPAEWFVEHAIQFRTGRRVSHLDVVRNTATFDDGQEISFGKLLIATGASARPLGIPGAELPNLFYLRTIEDAELIQHAIAKALREGRSWREAPGREGRGKAIVIGGGVLGVELAATLAQSGLHVDLSLSKATPWNSLAGENTGRCIGRFLEKNGIVLHPQARTVKLEGDGRVQRAVLSTGEAIECDLALSAVGLQISKDLLRGAPIAAEKAILVNEFCQTNQSDIYAAGDCAAIFDPLFGKHRPAYQFESAAITGRIAGLNMAGRVSRFDVTSHFQSRVFGLEIDVWGDARRVDRRIIRGAANFESPQFVEIGVSADGRVDQVIAVGSTEEKSLLRELVSSRLRINGNEEILKDPSVPLANLPK